MSGLGVLTKGGIGYLLSQQLGEDVMYIMKLLELSSVDDFCSVKDEDDTTDYKVLLLSFLSDSIKIPRNSFLYGKD